MFATGDCTRYMIVKRSELLGTDGDKFYNKKKVTVRKSVWTDQDYSWKNEEYYSVKMTRKENHKKHPWVTMEDIDGNDPGYLYGGNMDKENTEYVKKRHGAYVFIKNSKCQILSFDIFQ